MYAIRNKIFMCKVVGLVLFVAVNGASHRKLKVDISGNIFGPEVIDKAEYSTTSAPNTKVYRQTETMDSIIDDQETLGGRFIVALLPTDILIGKYGNKSTPPPPQPTD